MTTLCQGDTDQAGCTDGDGYSGGSFQSKLEVSKSCDLPNSRLEAIDTTHKVKRFNPLEGGRGKQWP